MGELHRVRRVPNTPRPHGLDATSPGRTRTVDHPSGLTATSGGLLWNGCGTTWPRDRRSSPTRRLAHRIPSRRKAHRIRNHRRTDAPASIAPTVETKSSRVEDAIWTSGYGTLRTGRRRQTGEGWIGAALTGGCVSVVEEATQQRRPPRGPHGARGQNGLRLRLRGRCPERDTPGDPCPRG